jgi:ADP-heptose:LPS heptosyltransferase
LNHNSQSINNSHICIIQVTRIGDLIQTIQACRFLKSEYPGIKLTLLARRQFAKQLTEILNTIFENVIFLDLASLVNPRNLQISKSQLSTFLDQINTQHFHLSVNFSFSKSSEYLSSLITADKKIGLKRNQLAYTEIADQISQYIFSNVMGHTYNKFNLVDLYSRTLGTKSNLYRDVLPESEGNIITIHPFASQERKQWSPQKWSEVIYSLCKHHPQYKITLVGSKSEINRSLEILDNPLLTQHLDRISNLVGKTTLMDLFHLLKASKLFVGHDSMGGHMASLAQTQSLTVSLGSVRPHETTPYGNLNYCISPTVRCFPCMPDQACGYYSCHNDISVSVLLQCMTQLLSKGVIEAKNLEQNIPLISLQTVKIYVSHITEDNTLKLNEIFDRPLNTKELFSYMYEVYFRYVLFETELKEKIPQFSNQALSELGNYQNAIQNIYELGEFGKKYAQFLENEYQMDVPNIEKINQYKKNLNDIFDLLEKLATVYAHLEPIVKYFKVRSCNVIGNSTLDLVQQLKVIFEEVTIFSKIFFNFSQQITSMFTKSENFPQKNVMDN